MARPKGSKNKGTETQGEEVKVEVKEVKAEEKTEPLKELKKGDLFLVLVDGAERYWTKTQAHVAVQRNSHNIEVPKGSSLILPKKSDCINCG